MARRNKNGNESNSGGQSFPGFIPFVNDAVKQSVTQLAFGNVLGVGIEIDEGAQPYYIPGIITYDIVYGPGASSAKNFGTNAFNLATQDMYQYLRHKNGRISMYDQPDVGIVTLGMASFSIFHADIKRLYGIINQNKAMNRYYVESLITAMGYNAVDIIKHQTDLGAYLNTFADQANVYKLPGEYPFYRYMAGMFQDIYRDGDGEKAQTMLLRPAHFYVYNEMEGDGQKQYSNLQPVLWQYKVSQPVAGGTGETDAIPWFKTFDDIVEMGRQLITSFQNSASVEWIGSDVENAYGDNLLRIGTTPLDYQTTAVRSEQMMEMLHNATVLPGIQTTLYQMDGLNVRSVYGGYPTLQVVHNPSDNIVRWHPKWIDKIRHSGYRYVHLVDTWRESLSSDDVARLMAFKANVKELALSAQTVMAGAKNVEPDGDNFYFLTNALIWTRSSQSDDELPVKNLVYQEWHQVITQQQNVVANGHEDLYPFSQITDQISQAMYFDWMPIMYQSSLPPADNSTPNMETVTQPSSVNRLLGMLSFEKVYSDLQNYSIITRRELQNYVYQQTLLAWNVPNR